MKIDENYSKSARWTDSFGSYDYTIEDMNNISEALTVLAGDLYKQIAENVRAAELVNTGSLLDPENYKTVITEDGQKKIMDFYLSYYFDFINQGVKGVKSAANAPGSPYQFKNYGMSPNGKKSIMAWIKNNRAITEDTTKKRKVGLELKYQGTKKKLTKTRLERETETAIYLIKKYGIKRTDYFTKAVKSTFSNIEERLGKALIEDLKINIILTNQK